MFGHRKENQRIQMLDLITDLLMDTATKSNERKILLASKKQLEQHEYFPRIINDLKAELTPLAVRGELSVGMRKLYSDYVLKNLASVQGQTGLGIAMNFGAFFH